MTMIVTYGEDDYEDIEPILISEDSGPCCWSCDGPSGYHLPRCIWCGVEDPMRLES